MSPGHTTHLYVATGQAALPNCLEPVMMMMMVTMMMSMITMIRNGMTVRTMMMAMMATGQGHGAKLP